MDWLEFINNGENSKLEFKEIYSNNDSIAGEIVSFLNAQGGIILFGVSNKREILWIDNVKEIEEKIANISRNNIFPEVVLDFEIITVKGEEIFVLKIPMGKNKPYEVKSTRKKYIRVQTTKREVSREEEVRLWQSSGNLKYDNILLSESDIEEIEVKKIENFVRRVYGKSLADTGLEYNVLLQNLDIVKKDINDLLYPTFSGLYFFGKSEYVRRRIASSFLIFAYFKGDSIWWSEILDKKDIEGTFTEIYDSTISLIHKYNAEYKQIKWYKADIRYDYPLEAIRETLMNAMLHRDYTYIGANIRVFMFDDRLEIISPGVLPNGLTLEALKTGIYQRFTRNEYIINFASKTFSDVVDGLGSGINRIKEICKKWGYSEPKYFLTDSELRVVYYKKPVENRENLSKIEKKPVKNRENLSKIEKKPVENRENLSKKQQEIFEIIQKKGKIGMFELEKILGTKRQTILEHLNKLIVLGLIRSEGKGRSVVYLVND